MMPFGCDARNTPRALPCSHRGALGTPLMLHLMVGDMAQEWLQQGAGQGPFQAGLADLQAEWGGDALRCSPWGSGTTTDTTPICCMCTLQMAVDQVGMRTQDAVRARPSSNQHQHNTQPNTTHNQTQHNTTPHHTTQHNTTQHNTTQHNTTQHNTTQHNTTQHNTTQHGQFS